MPAHMLYLAGMVLISHRSLALSVAWMCAAVLPDGYPKAVSLLGGREGDAKERIVSTSDLDHTSCTE